VAAPDAATVMLYPGSLAFGMLAALRARTVRAPHLTAARLPFPSSPGQHHRRRTSAKRSLVLWLTALAQQRAIVRDRDARLRRQRTGPEAVRPIRSGRCGDEAVLPRLAPVARWGGPRRPAAGTRVARGAPGRDIIVSDDGLQHYACRARIEIAVLDGARGLGQ